MRRFGINTFRSFWIIGGILLFIILLLQNHIFTEFKNSLRVEKLKKINITNQEEYKK